MIISRKMNEADKERFKREKELYDRGVAGGGVATVRVAAPAPVQEAGTVQVGEANIFIVISEYFSQCIRAGCTNPSVRNVEWEDEYCSNQCVVTHCDQVFTAWVAEQQKSLAA